MDKEELQKIFAHIDEARLVNVILNLIRIPAETGEEEARSEYIKSLMEELDLEVITQIVEPGRGGNQIGVLKGAGGGKNLMIHAHIDGWPSTREQELAGIADGSLKDGKIYGPGTGDQLAPVAGFWGVMDTLKRAGLRLKGDLLWAQVIDEEMYMTGTKALAETDCFGADLVLIGEPNDFNIGAAHTGIIEMIVETKGYAGHPSHINLGFKYANAVASMNKIINKLYEMQERDPLFNLSHPMLGRGNVLYIGPIIGGFKAVGDPLRPVGPGRGKLANAYMCPEWCRLRMGVRTFPGGGTTEEIVQVIKKYIEEVSREDPSVEAKVEVYIDRNLPMEIPEDSPAVQLLRKSISQALGKEPEFKANMYCTDLPPMLALKRGIPGTWTGPGLARYLRPDEHVTVQELVDTVKVFLAAAIEYCGVAE